MGFYSRLMDYVSGINAQNKPMQRFVFGSIVSGTYANWKTDPHPTILCLGNYQKNGEWYVHGIQLHNAGGNLGWLLGMIQNLRDTGTISTPYMFFTMLKYRAPGLIEYCYRTYITSMCDFKVVNPGFSNISEEYCYPISDGRDYFLQNLSKNKQRNIINMDFNSEQLRRNITAAINSVKVWN